MATTSTHELKNPGKFALPQSTTTLFLVMIVLGVVTFGLAMQANPERAWISFVMNHFFFMSVALGGVFFAAIQWLTSAMWSSPIRRFCESMSAYLPFAFISLVLLMFGVHWIYLWSQPEVLAHDVILQEKSGYLNIGFFAARNIIALGVLFLFAAKLVKNSLSQDKDGSPSWTARNKALSPLFIILFGVIFTMASFDQIMSLDAHWFSTMFGVYCFSGAFYAALGLTTLMALHFRKQMGSLLNDNHIHDLGKFMFGMAVFYAYIGFSQFMLIWYANIPEETMWFMHRMHGGWMYVTSFLAFGKFAIPFFVLLPRHAKRDTRTLTAIGIFMLVAHWIDCVWMVQPNFYSDGPHLGWVEIGMAIGFTGVFGYSITKFLSRNNIVAMGDPRLEEAVFHHQQ